MASEKITAIIDSVKELSVLELKELIDAYCEEFGVSAVAAAAPAAAGGKENVKDVGYCATRLRFEVKDNAKVDEKAVKAAGAAGVIRPSKNACQVIIGTKVQFVYDELKKML